MPIDNFAQQDSPVAPGSADGAPVVIDRSSNNNLIRSINQACDVSKNGFPTLSITGLPQDGTLPTACGPQRLAATADGQRQVQPEGRNPQPSITIGNGTVRNQPGGAQNLTGDLNVRDIRPQSPFPQNTDGGFSADQMAEIFRMRDRAMSLHRGETPAIGTIDGGNTPGVRPGEYRPGQIRPGDNNDFRPKPGDVNRPGNVNEKVKFETSEIDQAIETAARLNKPLIVKLGFPGCGACVKMGRESWPHVKDQLARDAVFLDVNVTESEAAAQRFPADSYPTTVAYRVTTDGAGRPALQEMGRNGFMDKNGLTSFLSDMSRRQREQPEGRKQSR